MTSTTTPGATSLADPQLADVQRAIARRSFCTLATTSSAERPHVAGVLYAEVDGALYVSTMEASRKARNIAANPHVAVMVPIRRLPVGPPSSVQYTSTATILANDDPEVQRLASAGQLGAITGHGELELDGGCIVRVDVPSVIHTYGLGLSLFQLIRHPLLAGGRVSTR